MTHCIRLWVLLGCIGVTCATAMATADEDPCARLEPGVYVDTAVDHAPWMYPDDHLLAGFQYAEVRLFANKSFIVYATAARLDHGKVDRLNFSVAAGHFATLRIASQNTASTKTAPQNSTRFAAEAAPDNSSRPAAGAADAAPAFECVALVEIDNRTNAALHMVELASWERDALPPGAATSPYGIALAVVRRGTEEGGGTSHGSDGYRLQRVPEDSLRLTDANIRSNSFERPSAALWRMIALNEVFVSLDALSVRDIHATSTSASNRSVWTYEGESTSVEYDPVGNIQQQVRAVVFESLTTIMLTRMSEVLEDSIKRLQNDEHGAQDMARVSEVLEHSMKQLKRTSEVLEDLAKPLQHEKHAAQDIAASDMGIRIFL